MASDPDRKLYLHPIDPQHIKRDLEDESLLALLNDGWTVVTSGVLTDTDRQEVAWALILEAPLPPPAGLNIPQWVYGALVVLAASQVLQVGLDLWVMFGG